ncbi:zinc finger and SCAN domain-containing protein 21-like isoform X2 [Phycodurus eques]|uniref:zinc finger and SCAN domain-containing protein 21-like isoform X2 n=1 Tax=Phycodurus eques TaxID=693459 RepID=UPI002ACD5CA7|nr:zinc finger and SCAN domain-containing protein 21-like isoform X2 [Phycodurus eques]
MCARRTAEYEEKLCGPKDEKEPRRQLLDAVFKLHPRVARHRADVSENLHPERQQSVSPHNKEVQHIKEEDEELLHIKEEEQEEIIKVPSTGVPLKSEDEGQSEERRGAEPPSSSSSQHMTTEGDGDLCGGSQADGLLAPLSDSDDMTSYSAHTDEDDDDEQSEGDMTCHTDNKRWKCSQCGKTFANKSILKQHLRTHNGEKPFSCSVCGQTFSVKGNLTKHTRTHTGRSRHPATTCQLDSGRVHGEGPAQRRRVLRRG